MNRQRLIEKGIHPNPSWITKVVVYIEIYLKIYSALLLEIVRKVFGSSVINDAEPGYKPLMNQQKAFYLYYVLAPMFDCGFRVICSRPDSEMDVYVPCNRAKFPGVEFPKCSQSLKRPLEKKKCMNLSAYNYFGLISRDEEQSFHPVLMKYGTSFCGDQFHGYNQEIASLERNISAFVGKEDAVIISQGFSTNSLLIPAFGKKGNLFLIDSKNHCSTLTGLRGSGITYKKWNHNDHHDLEKKLRLVIAEGQDPKSKEWIPWDRIVVIAEGIYSMEGVYCPLPELVALRKKYGFILYIDEAHSIGALGPSGRGVCDHFGVDPNDVDILMGTFTKSFCSFGGYVASTKKFCDFLRMNSPGARTTVLNPICIHKVNSYLSVISGQDGSGIGQRNLLRLRRNSVRLFDGLKKLGFEVVGQRGSQVVLVMVYMYFRITPLIRGTLKRGLASVCSVYPAVGMFGNRIRFCVNSNLSDKDIDRALEIMDEVGDLGFIKYKYSIFYRLYRFVKRCLS